MATEIYNSAIERMLRFNFVSDPRLAKFPLPAPPEGHPPGKRYTVDVTITPEMAQDILKYRVIRRDVMPKELQHDEMCSNRRFLIKTLKGTSRKRGLIETVKRDWNSETFQPMAFTWDGFLIDGQHRSAACYLADRSITLPVVGNASWGVFGVTDVGASRTAGQLLNIPHGERAAAIARRIYPVLMGDENMYVDHIDSPSNQEIYDLVMNWPFFHGDGFHSSPWMKELGKAQKTRIPVAPLGAAVMMALAAGASSEHVQSFLNGLDPLGMKDTWYETIGKKGEDPRRLLALKYRNRVPQRQSSAFDDRRAVAHCRQAMSVWLDWVEGIRATELSQLSPVSRESSLPPAWKAEEVREFHENAVDGDEHADQGVPAQRAVKEKSNQ